MSDETNNPETRAIEGGAIDDSEMRREILIGRAIDGEASPDDWDALRALAEQDPAIWNDLNAAQRQQELLCAGVSRACAIADEIEIDDALVNPEPMVRRLRLVGAWGGWAAAAGLALFWALGINPLEANTGGPVASAIPVGGGVIEPDDALRQYIQSGQEAGRVIREVPNWVVVRAEPIDGGRQVEVLYLRQILERRIVDQVYRESMDEFGNPLAEPVRLEADTDAGSIW